ncbi:germin-like protein subfamily 3 member 3 [Silene latifolia]|uniref:germin-like protein subfamily 3 member 3 n=1 Tax=Silene latifolia TaxID=37657 RepID=UPI003D76C82E
MNNLAFFITCSLIASISHAIVSDFCVGDINLPMGPSGYACKNPSNVTLDDFIFTGFRVGGPTNNGFKNNVHLAFADAYPGLNGLGISIARLDLAVGGSIPMHTHRSSEVIILVKGTIIAGFIDNDNVAYYKTLEVGDVMIFPQGLLHFQVNVGKGPALAFVSLNSANPGLQVTSTALFAGNLPAEIVEKTTLIDHSQVLKLRKMFGNSS